MRQTGQDDATLRIRIWACKESNAIKNDAVLKLCQAWGIKRYEGFQDYRIAPRKCRGGVKGR